MTSRPLIGFAIGASASAALGGAALLAWSAGGDPVSAGWALIGYASMALPGIAGGTWLAREHGRPGSRFVIALGAGFGLRLVLAAFAAFSAASAGAGAGLGLVAGLAAGFVPVTAFEMIWFARSRAHRMETEARG